MVLSLAVPGPRPASASAPSLSSCSSPGASLLSARTTAQWNSLWGDSGTSSSPWLPRDGASGSTGERAELLSEEEEVVSGVAAGVAGCATDAALSDWVDDDDEEDDDEEDEEEEDGDGVLPDSGRVEGVSSLVGSE